MTRPWSVFFLICAIWAALLPGASAAARASFDFVVIASSNIGKWPIGIQLRSRQRLVMNAADTLRAVNSMGYQIVLMGPGTRIVPPSASGTDELGLMARLLEARASIIKSFVVRQGELPRAVDPWWIDLTSDGAKCVRMGPLPWLWQPAGVGETRARLSLRDRNVWVTWPANAATVAWPADLPLGMGQEYSVEIPALHLVRVFRVLPFDTSSDDAIVIANSLLSHGCVDQAMRYLESLPLADGPV